MRVAARPVRCNATRLPFHLFHAPAPCAALAGGVVGDGLGFAQALRGQAYPSVTANAERAVTEQQPDPGHPPPPPS